MKPEFQNIGRRAVVAGIAGAIAAPSIVRAQARRAAKVSVGRQPFAAGNSPLTQYMIANKTFESAAAGMGVDLTVDWRDYPSAIPMVEAFVSGNLDFGMWGNTPIVRLIAQQAPIVLLNVGEGRLRFVVAVRPGSPIRKLADLKGKTVGALLGIAVVNVGMFAYPADTGYSAAALATPGDRAAYFLVMALFALKSYSLFAMMFGAGVGQQFDAAQRQGRRAGGAYARRLLGLALLGAFNVWALFMGDILLLYAALGGLLWALCRHDAATLAAWGWACYALQLLLLVAVAALLLVWHSVAPDEMAAEAARSVAALAEARAGFGASAFVEVAQFRVRAWAEAVGPGLLLQGPGALAFMLLGLAALRRGWLHDAAHPQWQRCRRWWLPLGLLISAAGAGLVVKGDTLILPEAGLGIALLGLKYVGCGKTESLAKLWHRHPLTDPIVRGGARPPQRSLLGVDRDLQPGGLASFRRIKWENKCIECDALRPVPCQ